MQLVILHYHLNRGGVTSVVENHLCSLALLDSQTAPTRVAIVHGGRTAAWNMAVAQELPFECTLVAVPELEYDHLRSSEGDLYDALQAVLSQFDCESTVLHVHNHGLGKNAAIAGVLGRLANEGWRQLLQIHDFAEDLRPTNYRHLLSQADSLEQLHEQQYPQAAQIHYAVLNQRDYQVLEAAGIADDRLHLLPNPVQTPQQLPSAQQAQATKNKLANTLALPAEHRFILYPVRAIRRKNIGELLLWSLLLEDASFAVTLAPLNPQEQPAYQQWVDFAAELRLPVRFDIADRTELPFEEIYAAADAIITTSVAEGFGMVYLEASLAGRPLVGRQLPAVCNDFLAAGMKFPGLAETMEIPAEQIDVAALRMRHRQLLGDLRTAYGLPTANPEAYQAIDSSFSGNTIDFARLESGQQRSFLRQLKGVAGLRHAMRELNPILQAGGVQAVGAEVDADLLQINRQVIAENYSPTVIGERLSRAYRAVLASDLESVESRPAIAVSVLNSFVHPSQLFPLRLES